MSEEVGRTWVWARRGGEGRCRHGGGQDAVEDVSVSEEVEGRWSHCDLDASHCIYSHILEELGTLNWYTRCT